MSLWRLNSLLQIDTWEEEEPIFLASKAILGLAVRGRSMMAKAKHLAPQVIFEL